MVIRVGAYHWAILGFHFEYLLGILFISALCYYRRRYVIVSGSHRFRVCRSRGFLHVLCDCHFVVRVISKLFSFLIAFQMYLSVKGLLVVASDTCLWGVV